MSDERRSGWPNDWTGLQAFPHVAYALDRRLRFRCVNGAWDRFARENDAPPDQIGARIVGRPFLDGLVEPERGFWQRILAMLLDGLIPHHHEEIPCDGPHVSRRIVVTAAPTRDTWGAIDGVVFINYDVTTARQRASDEAWLAGAHTLARAAAHVMNNHLAITVGYAELLAHDPSLPGHLRNLAMDATYSAQEASNALARLNRVLLVRFDGETTARDPLVDLDRAIESFERSRAAPGPAPGQGAEQP